MNTGWFKAREEHLAGAVEQRDRQQARPREGEIAQRAARRAGERLHGPHIGTQRADQIFGIAHRHVVSFFHILRRFAKARCVATFSAVIDWPEWAAASASDISFSFNISTAWR